VPQLGFSTATPDSRRLRGLTVLPAEAVDAASRVHEALLACVKGMTLIADIHEHLFASGTRLKRVAAGT